MKSSCLTLLVIGVVIIAGDVRADTGLIVVVGTASDQVRATVGGAVEKAAREAGWSLTTRRLSRKELEKLVRCNGPTPFECVPASLTSGGVDRVFVVTVDNTATSTATPEVVLFGRLIVTNPQTYIVNRRYCERCAAEQLAQESAMFAQSIFRQLASQSGRTVLEIRTVPSGAEVVLDGQRIGVTNGSFNTFPGKHVVVLEKAGFITETVEVTVEDGKIGEVVVTLRASAVPPPTQHVRRSRRIPAMLLGAGGAAVAGGIALVAVDQDPSPTGGRRYWDTAPAGIVIGAAGFVALGVGTYLWRRASGKPSGPTATAIGSSVLVGWNSAF